MIKKTTQLLKATFRTGDIWRRYFILLPMWKNRTTWIRLVGVKRKICYWSSLDQFDFAGRQSSWCWWHWNQRYWNAKNKKSNADDSERSKVIHIISRQPWRVLVWVEFLWALSQALVKECENQQWKRRHLGLKNWNQFWQHTKEKKSNVTNSIGDEIQVSAVQSVQVAVVEFHENHHLDQKWEKNTISIIFHMESQKFKTKPKGNYVNHSCCLINIISKIIFVPNDLWGQFLRFGLKLVLRYKWLQMMTKNKIVADGMCIGKKLIVIAILECLSYPSYSIGSIFPPF